jgi:hypothetical protein
MTSDSQSAAQHGPVPPAITKPQHESVRLTGDLLPPFMPGRPAITATTATAAAPAASTAWDTEGALHEFDGAKHGTARQEAADKPSKFPLDAFFVPAGVEHVLAGYDENAQRAMADRVGTLLETMAREVRERGIDALSEPGSDELARLIAAAVAGYYSPED